MRIMRTQLFPQVGTTSTELWGYWNNIPAPQALEGAASANFYSIYRSLLNVLEPQNKTLKYQFELALGDHADDWAEYRKNNPYSTWLEAHPSGRFSDYFAVWAYDNLDGPEEAITKCEQLNNDPVFAANQALKANQDPKNPQQGKFSITIDVSRL